MSLTREVNIANLVLSGEFDMRFLFILPLQDLVEKVMVLSRSIETLRGIAGPAPGPVVAEQLTQYANLLASQGCLAAATSYLPNSSEVCEKWIGFEAGGRNLTFGIWYFTINQESRYPKW